MEWVLKEWVTSFTVIAIMGAMVDILLPNGSFRKYTGFIFGLILLVMVLQPLLQLLTSVQSFEQILERNNLRINMEVIQHQSSQFEEVKQRQIQSVFQKTLEDRIASQVERIASIKNVKARVTFVSQDGVIDLSNIERIELVAESNDNSIHVEPVIIDIVGDVNDKPDSPNSGLGYAKEQEIRKILTEYLEIKPDIIHINKNFMR